jgi:hypothetical protein
MLHILVLVLKMVDIVENAVSSSPITESEINENNWNMFVL